MAKFKIEDLNDLTLEQMRLFGTVESITDLPESKAKTFILEGAEFYELGSRINHVERLMMELIFIKFINNEL